MHSTGSQIRLMSDLRKLKTFSGVEGKIKRKRAIGIILKAERALFGKMVIITKNIQLHMRYALCRLLGPILYGRYPQQIARSQWKTSEAALANELQNNGPAAGEIFQASARVIDGMVLVLRLKSDHKKITDVGRSLSTRDLMFSLVCIVRIQGECRKRALRD